MVKLLMLLMIVGIDISHHNTFTEKEYKQLNNQIEFVYIKASEGKSFKDPAINKHYSNFKNKKVGFYHFFSDQSSADEQFKNFCNATAQYPMDLVPAIDYEKGSWKNSEKERLKILSELINKFDSWYGNVIIYCSIVDYPQLKFKFPKCNFWIMNTPIPFGNMYQQTKTFKNKKLDYNYTRNLLFIE